MQVLGRNLEDMVMEMERGATFWTSVGLRATTKQNVVLISLCNSNVYMIELKINCLNTNL